MLKDMDQRSPILGLQERRDFDKFLKFFSLKAVQVIVQSRNGERASTSSKPPAVGQHWFNLAIADIPEITVETKKTMEGHLPSQEHSMCIEISLKTNEGDSMVLETWCLGMNNRLDSHAKITYTVYNRMGMLLKSLVSVTRITPAYKLSRKQGIDYEICYRIYFGDVKVSELGEGFQTIHVGAVGSPVGSVTLSAAYRTNLSMAERQPTMPVKSDHYSSQDRVRYDSEGPWEIPIPCAPTGTQAQLHVGAGVRHVAEEIANASETEVTSPSNRFKSNTSNQSPIPNRPSSYQKSSGVSTPLDITKAHHTKGAFASSPVTADIPSNLPALSSTPPFASLLNNKNSLGSRPDTPENKRPHRNSLNLSNRKDSSTESSDSKQPPSNVTRSLWGNDDGFVLVELKPAFASPSGADGDLGSFYRECQKAPPLMMFDDKRQQTLNDVMDELDQELSSYNECLPVFDELVANLKISQSS